MSTTSHQLEPGVISAVLEAYTPEGVVVWLTGWALGTPESRERQISGVMQAWSGRMPDPIGGGTE